MPEKKGLSAFLKKNQKNKKAAGLAPDSANPDEDGLKEDVQAQEVDVGKNLAKETKNTPKDNHDDESSDEEEDDIGTGLRVGYIKEKKDVINKNKNTDENKKGYGLDDVPPSDSPAMASAVEKKVLGNVPKKTAESISFVGGKPKFGKKNKPGKFGDGF